MNLATFLREISISTPLRDCRQHRLLSEKTILCCEANGLKTVGELLAFYNRHYLFCGKMQDCLHLFEAELKAFCKRFWYLWKPELGPKFAPALDDLQFENIARLLYSRFADFPSQFGLSLNSLGARRFYQEYVQGEKSFHFLVDRLDHAARYHLENLRNELRTFAFKVQDMPASFEFDQFVETCVANYGCQPKEVEQFRALAEAGKFPLFGFLAYLMDNGYLMSKNQLYLMKHSMGWILGSPLQSHEETYNALNMQIPRIHKFKEEIPDELFNLLNPIRGFAYFLKQNSQYNFDLQSPTFNITAEMAERLNDEEEATFHHGLYTIIARAVFMPEYHLLKYQYNDFWNYYLVRKDIYEAFSFGGFFSKYGELIPQYMARDQWSKIVESINQYFRKLSIIYRPIVVDLLTMIASDCHRYIQSKMEIEIAQDEKVDKIEALQIAFKSR